ncbi:hypothetical protein BCR34DRAFT_568167 [Clohesyomyces aquaticus]|uniref:Uncharacterized protein n=1 Tax=Clohesyomyces aquaticus TaxID=1231657 RepID=A0A1Y1ZH67_9PLEO|nr:hypothetical protein BCR34DRAFT_568167 [Clohesyomyces aquaticus]
MVILCSQSFPWCVWVLAGIMRMPSSGRLRTRSELRIPSNSIRLQVGHVRIEKKPIRHHGTHPEPRPGDMDGGSDPLEL